MIHSETQTAEPEIGNDESSQTRQNSWVDRKGFGFCRRRGSGSGVSLGVKPHRPVFAVKTRNAGWLAGPITITCDEIVDPGRMLCSVDAGLGVTSWWWHGDIDRDDRRLCSAMMVELWMTKGEDGHGNEKNMGGKIGV